MLGYAVTFSSCFNNGGFISTQGDESNVCNGLANKYQKDSVIISFI